MASHEASTAASVARGMTFESPTKQANMERVQRAKALWQPRLRTSVTMIALTSSRLKDVRVRRIAELPKALKHNNAVKTTVESHDELANLKTWEQGDDAMYTKENVERRLKNRHHPKVNKLLNLWWKNAMAAFLKKNSRADPESMPKSVYMDVYIRMCEALLDEDEVWDAAEARRITEESWEEDSQGLGALTRTMFADGLFELTDVWTESVAPKEYCDFLRRKLTACYSRDDLRARGAVNPDDLGSDGEFDNMDDDYYGGSPMAAYGTPTAAVMVMGRRRCAATT